MKIAFLIPFLFGLISVFIWFYYNDKPSFAKSIIPESHMNQITLGGGCFWCTEAVFQRLKGVAHVVSGYAGGTTENPTYREVISGRTGHAEVIQVTYNPEIISFELLLEIFFRIHNPTTLNRQGNDIGTQYRSVVLHHNQEQADITKEIISMLNSAKVWENPIVTEVKALDKFYPAEEYHQNYFNRNSAQGYCQVVILPKIELFKSLFHEYITTATLE